jgi:hypothetical protein
MGKKPDFGECTFEEAALAKEQGTKIDRFRINLNLK